MELASNCVQGTILRRYKRFLADIELEDGSLIKAHVPNTGSMKNCWAPGWKVLVSHHNDAKRKLSYTLEMTHNGECWIGVNTALPNKIIKEALIKAELPPFSQYQSIQPEFRLGKSRIDFKLSQADLPDCYIEVKNVTLKEEGPEALFPDAVSTRGQKHLNELMELKKQGHRAAMLYLVQREDVNSFKAAKHIDPNYAKLLSEASRRGVEVYCFQCQLDPNAISIKKSLPIQ